MQHIVALLLASGDPPSRHRLSPRAVKVRRPASRTPGKVWSVFAPNLALLDRHNVKPQELKALSEVSLMGKITKSEALLFILDAIRESGDTED